MEVWPVVGVWIDELESACQVLVCVCVWVFFLLLIFFFIKGRVSTDIGNMELWARGWRIYFSELTVSFKPQGKFFNSLYFEHPGAKSATTYYRLYYSGYRLYPNTFHNTINKNVNHSNDTIDNLNQSSFHEPVRQCQGHLRTESFPALLTFCTAA